MGRRRAKFIDFFPAKTGGDKAPLAVFIHGGYWRAQHPTSYSHMAASLNTHGISVAVVGYDLCPQVTIANIIEELRAAILFLWRKHHKRMFVYGHSAGGHLAACMVATDWSRLDPTAPADLVPSATAISGVFDLSPLVQVSQNQDLRLTEESAQAASPLHWKVPAGRTFDAIVGGIESSEFLRQSKIVADGWRARGVDTRYEEIAGANHFTVVDPLGDANSAMSRRIADLAKRVQSMKI